MKVHIMELGRGKVDKLVEVNAIEDLYGVVSKHLLSSDIELRYNPEKNDGTVIVSGFRTVGRFSVITDKIPKESLHPATIILKDDEMKS
jgi:hypothetical protein